MALMQAARFPRLLIVPQKVNYIHQVLNISILLSSIYVYFVCIIPEYTLVLLFVAHIRQQNTVTTSTNVHNIRQVTQSSRVTRLG